MVSNNTVMAETLLRIEIYFLTQGALSKIMQELFVNNHLVMNLIIAMSECKKGVLFLLKNLLTLQKFEIGRDVTRKVSLQILMASSWFAPQNVLREIDLALMSLFNILKMLSGCPEFLLIRVKIGQSFRSLKCTNLQRRRY